MVAMLNRKLQICNSLLDGQAKPETYSLTDISNEKNRRLHNQNTSYLHKIVRKLNAQLFFTN